MYKYFKNYFFLFICVCIDYLYLFIISTNSRNHINYNNYHNNERLVVFIIYVTRSYILIYNRSITLKNIITEEGLECYYCESDSGTPCDADEIGSIIKCQMQSPYELHYGDVCAIGHTGINHANCILDCYREL